MRRFFYKISRIVSSFTFSSITATGKNKVSLRSTPKDFMKYIYSTRPTKAVSALMLLLMAAFCAVQVVAQTTINTFSYTGAVQTYVVPVGVTTLTVDVRGGKGGNGSGGTGANGGRATATLNVSAGQVLNIYVGGAGSAGGGTGFNGGGSAGNISAGSGGDASDIRIGGTALGNRIIIAGGGGGASGFAGGNGGAGGTVTGAAGSADVTTAAGGGTQAAGGAAGVTFGSGTAGSSGQGGAGNTADHGGGGGGGDYGGGGGDIGGGGGGSSSYDGVIATGASFFRGTQSGAGQVIITAPCTQVTPSVAMSSDIGPTICSGTTVNFSAAPTNGGASPSYQWYKNGTPVGTNSNLFSINTLVTNDIISVAMTSNAACATPVTVGSNSETFNVNPTPAVTNSNTASTCSGTSPNISLTASVPSTFAWTLGANTGGITGASASSGSSINQTLTNPSNTTAGSILYYVTPTSTVSGSCPGAPTAITVTVNPAPALTSTTTPATCSGTSPNISLTASLSSTFAWTLGTNTGGITGASVSSGSSINQTLTNPSNTTAGSIVYNVKPTSSNSCTGAPTAVTVTVNPAPAVTTPGSASVCDGTTTNVVLTASLASTFSWSLGTNTGSITGASAGSGSSISQLLGNPSNSTAGSIVYNVTPTSTVSGSCTGAATAITVTVNPTPAVTNSNTASTCSGTGAGISLTASVSSNFAWTPGTNTGGITGANTGSGSAISDVLTNPSNTTAGSIVYSVTPTSTVGSCPGSASNITVTVNPAPALTSTTTTATCSGTSPNLSLTASLASNFSWTLGTNTGGITGASASSGSSLNQTLTNPGNTIGSIVYNVTPTSTVSGSCTGAPTAVTVTVNPTPTVNSFAPIQVTCNGGTAPAITPTGSLVAATTYNWANSNTNVGLAGSGTGTIPSYTATNSGPIQIASLVTVTPVANGCNGTSKTYNIGVNPTPAVNAVSSQSVCNNSNSTAVTFTGFAPGSSYPWTNNNTTIGLAASGAGPTIASFLATNPGSSPITGTITITPTITVTGVTCLGSTGSFTYTVNPIIPSSVALGINTSNTICAGTVVTFTATPTNGGSSPSYQWNKNGSPIGTTNPFSYSNLSNSDIVTCSMTSNAACPSPVTSNSNSVTFTVVPTPTVNSVSSQTVCNGTVTNAVTFSGTPSGVVFNWTNTIPSIGLAASSSGNIGAFTGTNGGSAVQNALITVTPSYTSAGITCQGTPSTFNITVNPIPNAIASSNPTVCNGTAAAAVTFSGNVTGTVYTWTNNAPSIGLAASGVGSIASFTPTNSTNAPLVATVTVTPSFTNNSVTCTGTLQSFTYTDNPIPTVNPISTQTVCNGTILAAVNFTGFVPGTTYNWTNSLASIGLAASGTGNIASFTATNSGSSQVFANIVVTPTANGCTGTSQSFRDTVNPTLNTAISVNASPLGTICGGTQVTFTALGTNGGTNAQYQWQKNSINTGTNSTIYIDNNLNNNDVITCTLISSVLCPTPPTITSSPITMSVNIPPSVASQPLPSSVCAGSSTSFNITASGAGLTYQWQANGVNISNGTTYSGVTTNTLSINNAGSVLNGTQYRCVVTGSCTPPVNSNAALLTVYTAPSITTQPVNTTVCVGANQTISVSTTGSGLTYQWMVSTGGPFSALSNGGVYSGVNAATLSITSAVAPMNGYQYQCVVSGFCTPGVTSNIITLTVNTLPAINTQPVSTNVCSGNNTNFSVAASGSGLTYQWILNGTTTITNIGVYTGATTNTLNITGALGAMNGNTYQCIVSGACTPAVNSNVVTLSVFTPTVINQQPPNTIVCAGSNTTISVNASGTNTYQWQVNSGAGFVNVNGAPYSGGNTNTLVITNATLSMSGYTYQCIISNPCNLTNYTSVATLTVNSLPNITANPAANTVICAGSNTSMSTTATGTALTYQWKVNGTNITVGAGVYSGFTTNTLNITGATAVMNGNVYQCAVSGYCTPPAITSNDTLRVNTLPAVFTQPVNTSVCAGSNTTLYDSSTGTGITYQWYRNNGSGFLPLQDTGIITGSATTTLHINGAYANMNGYTYKCITTGTCNPAVTSNIVTLTVNTLPAITVQPATRTTVCAGSNATMTDTATGTALTYQWKVNGSNITVGAGVYSGFTTNTLNITGATAGMNGNIYTCTISGTCTPSVTTTNDTLRVNILPQVYTQPVSSTICAGNNTSFYDSSLGTGITYQWQLNGSNISNGLVYSGATTTTLTITGATAAMNGGQYKCITSGTCTPPATSSIATLTVNTSPNITSQPGTNGNTITCVGSSTPITVGATGTSLLYQWQVNTGSGFSNVSTGLVYTGATSATLNILSPTTAMSSYIYRCMISGVCTPSPIYSNPDTLTVNILPAIALAGQPGNDTICAGSNASFSITATGTALTYQWFVNTGSGFNPVSNGGVYSGAITNTLNITSAPAGMNGNLYYCVASGYCSPAVTSSTVKLTVYTAPHISSQALANDTVCVGSNTTISDTATGTALTYQWQVNSGAGFTNVSNGLVYSGATSNALTIINATYAMNNYRYQCIISGTCTPSVTTSATTLTVNTLPTITIQPVSTSVCVGLNTQFTVGATGTGIIYIWQVNTGSGFTTVSNGGVYSGATTNMLTISAAPIVMNGYLYRCIISGVCTPSVITNTDTLTVNALPPAIITSSGPTMFCPNGNVILNVNTGSNIVSYQWKLNTSNIANASNTSYTASAIGNYTCMVTNINGCSNTSNIIPVSQYPAQIASITAAGPTTFCTGGNVVLNANGGTNLSYQWLLNGSNIIGATANTYTANATGTYTVQVTNQNACSGLSSITYVVVNPAPPAFITPVGNTSFCQGHSVLLVANSGSNYTYHWYRNGVLINGATGASYIDSNTGVITVKVTDTACSTTSAGVLATSNPYPVSSISSATGYKLICVGSNLVLQASTAAGLSYQWIYNGTGIFGANSSYYAASAAGFYNIALTSAAGCTDTGSGIILSMDTVVNPIITLSGGNMLCTGSFATISWYLNGNLIPGSTGLQCITATQPGSYTVQAADSASCPGTSLVYAITTGVENVNLSKDDIRLYPNPATSVMHIDAKMKVNVAVLNLQGQLVLEQKEAKDIDISSLANGVYMIQVYDQNHLLLKSERLIKNGL